MMMNEPIAIVGSACRFPGPATSPSKLWELLENPHDVLQSFPAERLNLDGFYSHDGEHHGRTNVTNKAYLLKEDVRHFDPAFFRINPKEAAGMDPQQRILLETVYECIEAAGIPLDIIDGSKTSVHVGVMTSDWDAIQNRDVESLSTYAATGTARSILSNRISYVFNLKGPSVSLDTACSSSLVALHQAVHGLRNGDAAQAVVAGTTLLLDSAMYIAESTLHMLSPDSRSRMWDKAANGYARGEGCAALLLKPLSKAIDDGDHIECVIRQTGVNSDGRTDGITMPSSIAQTTLIRQTYSNAGLDISKDRCQFFECHGTGTLAGDPVEARAIHEAFFTGPDSAGADEPLYCGSIKSVIGHLEGCAGLAGVMKASLAIQNKTIPPNMHFDQLNPAIEPYYEPLNVPTSAIPWPDTHGAPLRASVNSFGFGGTNAHVILESYEPASNKKPVPKAASSSGLLCGPFIFSAKTQSSLLRALQKTYNLIHLDPSIDLDALSWTLQTRRSPLATRVSIAATDRESLLQSLRKHIESAEKTIDALTSVRAASTISGKLLGIFTGQGAQWSAMAKQMIEHSQLFCKSIEKCEIALQSLPDPPHWSLKTELLEESSTSRINQAEFSQPLCTAIQIALVDVLRAVGIQFTTVVGHSSGEIGAAYSAGILSIRDAMGIAYYRGFFAHMAQGANGQKGGMMAVGISYQAALVFCRQSRFSERVWVAASNAPSSVTLSGDLDAITEAKQHFDKEGLFARQLKVDTAYHSAHMLRCAEKYADRLLKLDIELRPALTTCSWMSSVYTGLNLAEGRQEHLKCQYWVDNLTHAVLFSQAVETAVRGTVSFDMGFEVGPHPALKSAVGQTLTGLSASTLPYTGCLERGVSDVSALAAAIGRLWCHCGSVFSYASWRRVFGSNPQPQILKGLPSYSWDHDRVYWHESRRVRNARLNTQKPHELLGRLDEHGMTAMTWRKMLSPAEVPWLRGHMFQGQIIFPAAGYVSLAAQAGLQFASGRSIRLIEVIDTQIQKALVMADDDSVVEVIFTLRSAQAQDKLEDDAIVETDFACYFSADGSVMDRSAEGRMVIHLGQGGAEDLPAHSTRESELPPLNVDRFFDAALGLGIDYAGVFRSFTSIRRMFGRAHACASWAADALGDNFVLHPAILDVAFQAGIATFASLAENAVGTPFLPSAIGRVVLRPTFSAPFQTSIEAELSAATRTSLALDISVYDAASGETRLQVDGLMLKAVAEPLPSEDRRLFAKTVWGDDVTWGVSAPATPAARASELAYIDAVDRTAIFWLRLLTLTIRPEEIPSLRWHHKQLLDGIAAFLQPVRQGKHPYWNKAWLDDDLETIRSFAKRYPDSVDLQLLTAVGENLPAVLRGEVEMLEPMLRDNLLGRLYTEGRGFAICNDHVADIVAKISHKHPRSSILEIGAGTGGTTHKVLGKIGQTYGSYTYTDISAGFFETAGQRFAEHASRMEFKTLNVERPPSEQGYVQGSYDVIIAANVLHATRSLTQTMKHTRSLLKPGGFLICVEVTGNMLRETGLMAGLEGWWLGRDDGRFPGPGISAKQWHDVLQSAGFSGVDTVIYDMPEISRHNCSVFVSQAVDRRWEMLHDPLAMTNDLPPLKALIVGGKSLRTAKLVRQAEKLLCRCSAHVKVCAGIDDINLAELESGTSVLCLTELDGPLFAERITPQQLENLQELLGSAQDVLWVTSGSLAESPFSNMMLGIGRALAFELPHVNIQFLDFDEPSSWDVTLAVQHLARLAIFSKSPPNAFDDVLWAQEPEVAVVGDQVTIPRVIPDTVADESLNAARRQIIKPVDTTQSVQILHNGLIPELVHSSDSPLRPGYVELIVEFSVPLSLIGESGLYLCAGQVSSSGIAAYAISCTNRSTVVVKATDLFEIPRSGSCSAQDLATLGAALVALDRLSASPTNGTLVVHEPTSMLATALTLAVESSNRKLCFTSSRGPISPGRIVLHPLMRPREIRKALPSDTTAFYQPHPEGGENIVSFLPSGCTLVPREFHVAEDSQKQMSHAHKLKQRMASADDATVVNICDLKSYESTDKLSHAVVDWRREGSLTATVLPLNPRNIFRSDKSYVLIGMVGELGQSLCRYMVEHGVRHIAVASRSPASDAQWIQDLRDIGANIQVFKMDVADSEQLRHAVHKIRQTMPAVAGVANAALVLEDSLFVNTTAAAIEKQLQPKVYGTRNLDLEFTNDDLEFFITFSSLGSVYGNPGQSIYHAANMYMTALIEKRRRRGKAASVIDVGMIADIGYVAQSERAGSNIEAHLRAQFYTPLAETEFHQLFLQGVLYGKPESRHSGEVIMGVHHFIDDPSSENKPGWYENPRFGHMIFPVTSAERDSSNSGTSTQQLRDTFESAESLEEATEALQKLFGNRIEAMMKVPAESIDVNGPLSDLGLDSLLAVEIRKWFLREIHFEIPVLTILGKDTLRQIVERAAKAHLGLRGSQVDLVAGKAKQTQDPATRSSVCHDSKEDMEPCNAESSENSPPTGASSIGYATPPNILTLSSENTQTPISSLASSVDGDTDSSIDVDEKAGAAYTRIESLSYPQASMLFLHDFVDDPTTFNVTAQYSITGFLNTRRFERALKRVLAHHEIYRTCFFTEPTTLERRQGVLPKISAEQFSHVQSMPPQSAEAFHDLSHRTWNLENGSTLHAVLISHASESHTLVIGCHHVAMDGMSWGIFLNDLDRAYRMLPLKQSPTSYIDFVCEQNDTISSGSLESSIDYWKQTLTPLPEVLPLLPAALSKNRPSRRSHGNHVVERVLDAATTRAIKEAGQVCGATPMHFYISAVQALLSKLLEIEDMVIGVTDAGRFQGNYDDVIGHFINILPMRFSPMQRDSFAELVARTSRTVLEGYEHAKVPGDVILEKLGVKRSSTHTPLYQVAFNYRVGDLLQRGLGDCTMELVRYEDTKKPYDLTFNVTQRADGGSFIELCTNDNLYSHAVTETVMKAFLCILESAPRALNCKVRDLAIFTEAEVNNALALGRGPLTHYSWPSTLIERFGTVCDQHPSHTAIKDGTCFLTYAQLQARVSAIAASLLQAGAGKTSVIAVLCQPTAETYAAMLAILSIGAVYAPLDLSLPPARHHAMLLAGEPGFLLYQTPTASAAQDCASRTPCKLLNMSEISTTSHHTNASPLEDAAYGGFLLFSSGSTGIPKGINLGQSGIMNYAASKSTNLGLGQVTVLQQSSTGFDMAVAQAFNAFANAGTLVVAPLEIRGDPHMIAQLMRDEQIEFTIATPSEYTTLASYANDTLKQCASWRHACSGGEAVTDGLVSELRLLELPHLNLLDCYGPTEISCAATFQTIPLAATPLGTKAPNSVGQVIPNVSVYILGEDSSALPAGHPGEICIAGQGLARGYLDAALTASKFVPNHLATPEDNKMGWSKMYRTGDKGYLRHDGSLVFVGRTDGDTLVKLRGLRIELEEVASAIVSGANGSLSDAIVTVRGDPQFLVAHVLCAHGSEWSQVDLDELRLGLPLPQYMIPAMIIAVDRLPTTSNGKIDRRAIEQLPLPTLSQVRVEGGEQLSVAEGELRLIWSDVLGEAGASAIIQKDSDFFQVGGSSLLLVHLQGALKEKMGIRLPLHMLYQASTLRRMAATTSNERSQLTTEAINWEAETTIPTAIIRAAKHPVELPVDEGPHEVLLTGSTDFLGSEILKVLLNDDTVERIHCIAIPKGAKEKLPQTNKIIAYVGNLLSPSLGLSQDEVAQLKTRVDRIIHAGASGHCLNNYTSVKNANYLSTQFLATIALARRIPLQFVSSSRVILQTGDCEAPPVSMANYPPPLDGSQGFTASKWASEAFLEKLVVETGLPVAIHRPCSVIGSQAPHNDAMNSVIKFSVESSMVPDVPQAGGFFDFKDVESVAQEIATGSSTTRGSITFHHHSSGIRVPWGQLADRMEFLYGGKFAKVSMNEWIQNARKLGIEDLIVSYLEANVAGAESLTFPYLGITL